MGRAPLLLPLAGVITGILIVEFFAVLPLWIIPVVLIIGVSGVFWRPGTLFYWLIFVALGWGFCYLTVPAPLSVGGLRYCSAEVLDTKETGGNAMIGVASIDSVDGVPVRPFCVTAEIIGHRNVIYPGERIAFHSTLETLTQLPHIEDVEFKSSTERHYGVVGFVMVLPDSLEFRGDADGIMPAMSRINRDLRYRLSQADVDDKAYSLLCAMLLGDKSGVQPSTMESFSAAGVSHLLALSGTHVAVILTLISIALLPITVTRRTLPRDLLSIALLWGYALLTGMSPSVVRAVIMASVYLFGRLIERTAVPLNSLCLAALVILLFNPADLFLPGFQMSFAAVAGIIIFYPLLNRVDRRNHPWLYVIVSYPALSVSAMVLTSLIAAWYFHVFPLYFLITNLIAVPLIPVILFCGVILLISPGFSIVAETVNKLCGFLESVVKWVASMPDALVADVYLPLWLTIALSLLLVVMGVSLHYRKYSLLIASAMLFVAALTANRLAPPRFAESEAFELYGANIVRSGNTLRVYSNFRNESEREYMYERYTDRLHHYCRRRGICNLELHHISEQ